MNPTYYVQHPDGNYSVADPQPSLPDSGRDAAPFYCEQCMPAAMAVQQGEKQ